MPFLDNASPKSLFIPPVDFATIFHMEINGLAIDERGILTKCADDRESIVLPKGIVGIASRAFENCAKLESIQCNEGLETIYDCAFLNCPSLKKIVFPSSLKRFALFDESFSVFEGCPNIETILIDGNNARYSSCGANVIFDKKTSTLLFGCRHSRIPPETKVIGSRSFYKEAGLADIELPEALTKIAGEAFYGCRGLGRLSVPKNLMEIDPTAFFGAELDAIEIDPENPVFQVIDGVLMTKDGVTVLSVKHAPVPASATAIGDNSFEGSRLDSVVIPPSVRTVGSGAFLNSSMKELVVSEGVKEILNRAFSGCHDLKKVYLPHSLLDNIDFDMDFGIARNAFFDCPALRTIVFRGSEEEWMGLCEECGLSFKGVEIQFEE